MDVNQENAANQKSERNNNNRKSASGDQYMDMRDSRGSRVPPYVPLIPPDVSYENASDARPPLHRGATLTELDEHGNPVQDLPGFRSSAGGGPPSPITPTQDLPSPTSGSPPPTFPPERSMSTVSRRNGPSDLPHIPEEQIALTPTPNGDDDVDGGYLEPTNHIYSEITEVQKKWEVTPDGSRVFTETTTTKKVPLMRRLTRSLSRKHSGSEDEDSIKCMCSKKKLLTLLGLAVAMILVIAIVVGVMLSKKDDLKPQTGAASRHTKDTIPPTITCPKSRVVTLTEYSKTIILDGAIVRDNVGGIASLEYIPDVPDASAVYRAPDRLVLKRESVGKNYTVLVITRDHDDNEARCRYAITVIGDSCVPWNVPEVPFSSREEKRTDLGWSVTLQCESHRSSQRGETDREQGEGSRETGQVNALSYYYLDQPKTFTCTQGTNFFPEKQMSCQDARPALYSYVTSLRYQFLNHDGSPLQNITQEKSASCFKDFYSIDVVRIQDDLSPGLKDDMVRYASKDETDLSQLELSPATQDYPHVLGEDVTNGRVQSMDVAFGYQVGPPGEAFTTSSLNVFVKGILRIEHNTLYNPLTQEVSPFTRLRGNMAAGCPDIQAPEFSSSFTQISSGFSCSEGEKRHEHHDEHLGSEVTVCLGCPVGEFYSRDHRTCEECPINSYQDITGAMECKLCPLNMRTLRPGARSQKDCVPL